MLGVGLFPRSVVFRKNKVTFSQPGSLKNGTKTFSILFDDDFPDTAFLCFWI